MAKVYGLPGEWARVRGTVYGMWPIFIGIFIGGAAMALLCCGYALIGVMLLLTVAIFLYFALQKTFLRVERYFKGARGEEQVSAILKTLPDTYCVYNDFVACGERVDHVVIGPAGVFSIETKFWRGRITIEDDHILLDGQLPDRSPVKQALQEAALVKTEMKKIGWEGTVNPVLVFASNTFVPNIAEMHGTVIMNSNELVKSFATAKSVVDHDELTRIFAIMENAK